MISKNGIALAVLVIEALLSSIGVEFDPGSVAKVVEGFVVLAALLLAIWNQVDRADVSWFVLKK